MLDIVDPKVLLVLLVRILWFLTTGRDVPPQLQH